MSIPNEQFNFSNLVSGNGMSNDPTSNFDCEGIMLEPRLQEYIKKVRFNQENNIDPGISLKTQYMITKDDMMKISAFMSGNKKIYPKKKLPKVRSSGRSSRGGMMGAEKSSRNKFPSSFWKTDKRVPKNPKPPKMNPEHTLMFSSMQDVVPDHNTIMDSRDFASTSDPTQFQDSLFRSPAPRSTRTSDPYSSHQSFEDIYQGKIYQPKSNGKKPYIDALEREAQMYGTATRVGDRDVKYGWEDPGCDAKSGCYSGIYSPTDQKGIKKAKKCAPNMLAMNHGTSFGGSLDSDYGTDRYGVMPTENYSAQSYMDEDTKMVYPSMNTKSGKQLDISGYTPIPFMGHGTGPTDVEMESYIQQGMPTYPRNRSYGYPSTEEFNFDYAPLEYQDPDHCVFPTPRGGVSTRVFNKSIRKSRQVMQ